MKKRLVIISDLHCGSEAGLSPRPDTALKRGLLARYTDCIAHLGARPDILVINGDAIDGTQDRGRGDGDSAIIHQQIADACALVKMWRPRAVYCVAGTQYHVGGDVVEGEQVLAIMLREGGIPATFHRKLNMTINDWFRVQFRHHIGSSGIPHGRHTPQSRSKVWGYLNAACGGSAPAHLSVYSHVHYWTYSEDFMGAAMTTPAWQAIGSRYGDERCDGHVDLGAVEITIGQTERQGWSWRKRLYPAGVVARSVRA